MFAGVGERTREGNDLYREMIESGVIKLGEKQVSALYYSGCFTMFRGGFFYFSHWMLHFCIHCIRVKANVLSCMDK